MSISPAAKYEVKVQKNGHMEFCHSDSQLSGQKVDKYHSKKVTSTPEYKLGKTAWKGNTLDTSNLAILLAVKDKDVPLRKREAYLKGLAANGSKSSLKTLVKIMKSERVPSTVRGLAAHYIGKHKLGHEAIKSLKQFVSGKVSNKETTEGIRPIDGMDRNLAIGALANLRDRRNATPAQKKQAVLALVDLLDNPEVNGEACSDIADTISSRTTKKDESVSALDVFARDSRLSINDRYHAIEALARIGSEKSIDHLIRIAKDANLSPKVRAHATAHLPTSFRIIHDKAKTTLVEVMNARRTPKSVKMAAARSLGECDDPLFIDCLFQLPEVSESMKLRIAKLLVKSVNPEIRQTAQDFLLKTARKSKDAAKRVLAIKALGLLEEPNAGGPVKSS